MSLCKSQNKEKKQKQINTTQYVPWLPSANRTEVDLDIALTWGGPSTCRAHQHHPPGGLIYHYTGERFQVKCGRNFKNDFWSLSVAETFIILFYEPLLMWICFNMINLCDAIGDIVSVAWEPSPSFSLLLIYLEDQVFWLVLISSLNLAIF